MAYIWNKVFCYVFLSTYWSTLTELLSYLLQDHPTHILCLQESLLVVWQATSRCTPNTTTTIAIVTDSAAWWVVVAVITWFKVKVQQMIHITLLRPPHLRRAILRSRWLLLGYLRRKTFTVAYSLHTKPWHEIKNCRRAAKYLRIHSLSHYTSHLVLGWRHQRVDSTI